MSEIDVRSINLNLLIALEALLIEGSVGAAARRVHVTQSAMSHSLSRLRELFGDPLLVAVGRQMTLTKVAARLGGELSVALDHLGRALAAAPTFSPATSRRVFRVSTFDYFEMTELPGLLAHLGRHAPRVGVEVERFAPHRLPALLAGEIDVALLAESNALSSAGLKKEALFDEPFAVLVRAGHPAVGRKLDLETYLGLGHVLVSVEGRRDGAVDRALAKIGRTRRVAVRVPHFLSAPLAVKSSDHICTIARGVAVRARSLYGLRVHAVPLDLPAVPVVALWSPRADADPASRWFREVVLRRVRRAPRNGESTDQPIRFR